jgi:hypothetical protein
MKNFTLSFLSVCFTAVLSLAQTSDFKETFPGGATTLNWLTLDGLSQLQIDSSFANPSGDSTVGFVAGNVETGGTGGIMAGSPGLTDYKIEAQVYMARAASASSGTNNGIYGRINIRNDSLSAYVLASDFDGGPRLRLRKFEAGNAFGLAVIRDWGPEEIPGGLPTESSWHKLALEFKGNQIWAYYDDELLPDSPFTDTESDSGYFGIYCFVGFDPGSLSATYFDDVMVTVEMATSVAGNSNLTPQSFRLAQNYPNPFNPETHIDYELDRAQNIILEIFNTKGQRVSTLFGGFQSAGLHHLTWHSNGLPSGTYMLRLRADGQSQTKRMILLE